MARKKAYTEEEVTEKAMALFWRNGFETTSMQMLEKEMGINKFSIYSSFGSKNGVFLKSIKCYRKHLSPIIHKLRVSQDGLTGLKQYFHDFLDFSKETNSYKGCLVVNTANELGQKAAPEIQAELQTFTSEIRTLFANNLSQIPEKKPETIEAEADYLLVSMVGLASASRMFEREQLLRYIESVFNNL